MNEPGKGEIESDQPAAGRLATGPRWRDGRKVVLVFGALILVLAIVMYLIARTQSFEDVRHNPEALHLRSDATGNV